MRRMPDLESLVTDTHLQAELEEHGATTPWVGYNLTHVQEVCSTQLPRIGTFNMEFSSESAFTCWTSTGNV